MYKLLKITITPSPLETTLVLSSRKSQHPLNKLHSRGFLILITVKTRRVRERETPNKEKIK